MRSASEYLQQFKALLPRGALWEPLREEGKTFGELLHALAEEFARVDASSAQIIEEADPRTTLQLLPEMEEFAGLPDPCSGLAKTIDQRRSDLLDALVGIGGQSRAYYIGLAAKVGFDGATITEYEPHTVDATVDAPIYGADWQFAWKITAPSVAVDQFDVMSTVDESLGEAAATSKLECLINRTKPSHTTTLFEYT